MLRLQASTKQINKAELWKNKSLMPEKGRLLPATMGPLLLAPRVLQDTHAESTLSKCGACLTPELQDGVSVSQAG